MKGISRSIKYVLTALVLMLVLQACVAMVSADQAKADLPAPTETLRMIEGNNPPPPPPPAMR